MNKLEAGLNRRNFLRNTGLAGLGVATATVVAGKMGALDSVPGASALGLAPTKVEAAGLSANDIAVLQFALNLEYLEAEFYCYVVTGRGLEDNGIPTEGAIGYYGPTTGGTRVKFEELGGEGPLRKVAEDLMRDEVNHVLLLRSFLGSEYTIAKPAIKLDALGAFDSIKMYLTLARDFEVTGVSAYGGAVTLVDQTVLQYAAQIALVEALHSGNLQLLCDLNKVRVAPLDQFDVIPPPAGVNFFDDSFNQGLAVIRNTSQVLSIVYGASASGTTQGGFFPCGVNGSIKTV
jgi:hypothetical protein